MTSVEIIESLTTIVNTLIPILAVLAVYKIFEWHSKRRVTKEADKVNLALDRLWPYVTPQCMAEMVINEPEAYAVLATHITSRQMTGMAKGLKL